MIVPRRSAQRGHADHGWLVSAHTFSFADYHDEDFMGIGALRVINQDRVAPSMGFGTHGHRDMEIVSVVLDGVLEHKDSMGNGSQMRPGEVQLMSAGTGVTHSEFNAGDDELHFLQMWVMPARNGTEPRYEQREFNVAERRGRLALVASPDGRDGSLTIGQDARLSLGALTAGERASYEIERDRIAWLHVARGALTMNGERYATGDGAAIFDERELIFEDGDDAEFVVWDLAEARA